ncbi:SEL1-like repeat protein [Vibrio panuliri]|uniref:hypothetical protein n=1 Tax=Vibrio panuliri TaxID=1381081 RepID=UPI0009FA5FF5|nr:hypothetical protein [Vibrio panuliri]KAB1457958.1 hypothetical protein F7O85_09575 [Vibrio panuliri]
MLTNLSIYLKSLLIAVFLFSTISVYAEKGEVNLTSEQAYQRGTLLFQQNKYDEATPYLVYATKKGYAGAALMLSITYNTNIFVQTPREAEYARKAAELGSVIGALKSDKYNSNFSKNSDASKGTLPKLVSLAKEGNAFAMRQVYNWTDDRGDGFDWLKKAAEAGDPVSQHELAKRYRDGDDWFLIPGKREREVERLFKASADSGDREGMLAYSKLLKQKK